MVPMSALGQKQTSQSEIGMSALPPKADIEWHLENVRFVPKAGIAPLLITVLARASNEGGTVRPSVLRSSFSYNCMLRP
jgi:hypothetical protein